MKNTRDVANVIIASLDSRYRYVILPKAKGISIVQKCGMMSDTLIKIYDDYSISLNKNAIEPGGKFKFDSFEKSAEFSIWYLNEESNVHNLATSGDNSMLAQKFKDDVNEKFKSLV